MIFPERSCLSPAKIESTDEKQNVYVKGNVYATFAKQNGENFDFDKKIVIKLSALECANLILKMRTHTSFDIIHKMEDRITSLKGEVGDKNSYKLTVFTKTGDNVRSVGLYLSEDEVEESIIYLKEAVIMSYKIDTEVIMPLEK